MIAICGYVERLDGVTAPVDLYCILQTGHEGAHVFGRINGDGQPLPIVLHSVVQRRRWLNMLDWLSRPDVMTRR